MALTKVDKTMVSDQVFGRRNLFINGKMQIAQRAATATGQTGTGFHTVDRWEFVASSAGTWDISQSTTVPSGEGFAHSQKLDCTSADSSLSAGDYLIWRQKIEGINLQHLKYGTSSAEKLTLSFWVRSAKTGTYIVEFYNNNSAGIKLQSQSYTISSANTWEKKTITIDGDTGLAFQNTTDGELLMYWWLAAGSNYTGGGSLNNSWNSSVANNTRAVGVVNLADSTSNDWYITGVQLEIGENATPFEHISYAEELRDCERYYQELPVQDRTFVQYSTTNYAYGGNINYWRPMRTTPTVTNGGNGEVYPNGGNKLTSSGLVSLQNPTYNRSQANVYHTTLSNSYTGYFVRSDNIKLDAEL
tara:strand:- start:66 stop:1142 length:1077 start_codon:yes stop_codon:yes gene_type:complete